MATKPYPQKEETPDVVYEWLHPHTMKEIQAICEEAEADEGCGYQRRGFGGNRQVIGSPEW